LNGDLTVQLEKRKIGSQIETGPFSPLISELRVTIMVVFGSV
jgi:hypothetical protein